MRPLKIRDFFCLYPEYYLDLFKNFITSPLARPHPHQTLHKDALGSNHKHVQEDRQTAHKI